MASTMRFDTWENPTGTRSLNIANATPGLTPLIPTSVVVGSGSASVNTLGTTTFTTANNISLNGIFTSAYTNYKIILKLAGSSLGAATYFRLRSAGTDRSNPNHYYGGGGYRESSGAIGWTGNGASQFDLNRTIINNPLGTFTNLEIANPFTSTSGTGVIYQSWCNDGSGGFGISVSGLYSLLNSNDGFTLWISTGTFDGTVTVYGYNA